LRNFVTMKQLNQQQVHWVKQLVNYEFQIHYKKNNENDEADTLSRQSDHEEVKKIHTEILSEDEKRILTKALTATYKMKQAFLTDEELIQVCHNSRVNEHLEVNISDLKD